MKQFNNVIYILVLLHLVVGLILYWAWKDVIVVQNLFNATFSPKLRLGLLAYFHFISIFIVILFFVHKVVFQLIAQLFYLILVVFTYLNYEVDCKSCGNAGFFKDLTYQQEFYFFASGFILVFLLNTLKIFKPS